ncbi:LacI family transcriptional regulator [Blautia schinkii]|nr:LacI family transcriptional regulator [Blautia schinkii]
MESKNKRITLKDIADACGYSVNTISRALRNDTRLPAETISRIQTTATELGYIRNVAASSLRSGQTNLIVAIIDDIQNPYYSEMLAQIARKLRSYDYHLFILCTQFQGMHDADALSLVISYNVSGIFLFPRAESHYMIQTINQNHIPLVFIGRELPNRTNDVVRCNDYQGGYLAGKSLIKQGHRSFAFLSGPWNSASQVLRYNGFMQALAESSMSADNVREISYEAFQDAILTGSLKKLLIPVDYTAICGFSDLLAYSAMNTLLENGYNIPEDVSIIGFDHLRQSLPHLLPLSSISYTASEPIADEAVDLMVSRIKNPDMDIRSKILSVKLYDEGTIGAVPQK